MTTKNCIRFISTPFFFSYWSSNFLKGQGPVSRKSRKLFGSEKPFLKLRPPYSVKLVFSYVVKGIKIKITAKFCATRRLHFEDNRRIMAPEKFRDFRETGPWPFRKLLLQYEKKKGVEIKRVQFFVAIFLKTTTSRRRFKKISFV